MLERIEAQRHAIDDFVAQRSATLIARFTEVHEHQPAARPNEAREPTNGADRVGHVAEQQPGEDQIEGRAQHGLTPGDVAGDEGEAGSDVGAQRRYRRFTHSRVDIEAGDMAARTDGLTHDAHDRARTTAGVEAAHTSRDPCTVEHTQGRRLKDVRLLAQPVGFSAVALEHVAVAHESLVCRRHAGSPVGAGQGRGVTSPDTRSA